MIQQGKYADYAGVAILGASPILIANIPHHRQLDGVSPEEKRRMIMEDNAKTSGLTELPMYHGARGTPSATSSTSTTCPTIWSATTRRRATP